jgi:hypothetical protein
MGFAFGDFKKKQIGFTSIWRGLKFRFNLWAYGNATLKMM